MNRALFLCLTGNEMGRPHHFVVGVYIVDGQKIEGQCISKDNVAGDGCQISGHVGDIRGAISRPQLVTNYDERQMNANCQFSNMP